MKDVVSRGEYNAEPVCFCNSCLSLAVLKHDGHVPSYCKECGSSSIDETNIEDWELMYEDMYGEKYLNPVKKRSWEISKIKQLKQKQNEKFRESFE